MGLRVLGAAWLLAALLPLGAAAAVAAPEQTGVAAVDGRRAIASTAEDFICATLDWWPPDKCDYGTCAWGRAGLLNLVTSFLSLALRPCQKFLVILHGRTRRGDTWFNFCPLTQDLSNKVLLNAVRGRRRRPVL